MSERINEMSAKGAVIGLISGPRGVLAHARIITEGRLHYVFSFDEGSNWDHVLEFARIEYDGYYIKFYAPDGKLLGEMAPLEDEQDRNQWRAWQDYIKTPAGMAVLESIERACQVHLTWK